MTVVTFDPHLLALPDGHSSAMVVTYCEALVAWTSILRDYKLNVTMTEEASSALDRSGRYPHFMELRTLINDSRVDFVDAQTLASATQNLLRLRTIEVESGILTVTWGSVREDLSPDPTQDRLLTEALLRSALLLLVLREWKGDDVLLAVSQLCRSASVSTFEFDTVTILTLSGDVNEREAMSGTIETVRTQAELVSNLQTGIRSGAEILERWSEFFPSLDLSASTHKHLAGLMGNDELVSQIVKKLRLLNDVAASWESGSLDWNRLAFCITGESEATLNRFADQRTFVCADGRSRVFSTHARLTPGAWRLYFLDEKILGRLQIGYIGPHLDIAG